MKKSYYFLVLVLTFGIIKAQNTTDALLYSQEQLTGSARFQGMGGAFGALGGDLSAISINPAGSAVFINSSAAISLSGLEKDNASDYFGTNSTSSDTSFNFNQGGLVLVFNNSNENSQWNKFTLGINYNNSGNFDDALLIDGNSTTSISNFFLEQAQGISIDLLELQSGESISDLYQFLGETQGVMAQNALLGYQGFIFNPLTNNANNTQYVSNVAPGNFNQAYYLFSEGYNGKLTFNFGTQFRDNFFFGINLNSHYFEYSQSTLLDEQNTNQGSLVNAINFQNNLSTIGTGFSAQLGVIAKVTEAFRVGLTYDTPTWYNISDETTQFLETQRTENNQLLIATINPLVLNIFEEYDLTTPGKLAASAAYVFGKKGLISFDYSYKDFSNIEIRSRTSGSFSETNTFIENNLKVASTYKIGGEYKIQDISLRAGYLFEESPYENETTVGDTNGFSLGLGYKLGNYNFDLAYSRNTQERQQQLYDIGLTNTANIETTNSAIVFTLGFTL